MTKVAARLRIGGRDSEMIAEAFRDQADPARRVTTPLLAPGCTSVYAQYTIEVANRDRLRRSSRRKAFRRRFTIRCRCHLQPVSRISDRAPARSRRREAVAGALLSLPCIPT